MEKGFPPFGWESVTSEIRNKADRALKTPRMAAFWPVHDLQNYRGGLQSSFQLNFVEMVFPGRRIEFSLTLKTIRIKFEIYPLDGLWPVEFIQKKILGVSRPFKNLLMWKRDSPPLGGEPSSRSN